MAGHKPVRVEEPSGRKQAGLVDDPDEVIKHVPMSWSLAKVDLESDWGLHHFGTDHFWEVMPQMKQLDGRTIHELLESAQLKDIPTEHLKFGPAQRLQEMELDDTDTLWEVRLSNKRRIWGQVSRATFSIIWWDPDESVCNPPPKGQRRR